MAHPGQIVYLSRADIAALGGESPSLYLAAVERALKLHAEGKVVQPLKPYLRPSGSDGHIADRIIAMPAALLDNQPIAGIKWIGSIHTNPERLGIERASGLIVLNDPATHYPTAVMEAGLISGMRTAAVTVHAARHLARESARQLTCIGCGPIARMQVVSLLDSMGGLQAVTLFDRAPEAAVRLGEEIKRRFPAVTCNIAPTAAEAVWAGDVVVTCTVTDRPYIPKEWLRPGTFVSNVSIMDIEPEVYLVVDKLVVDDWEQSNREKKVLHQLVEAGKYSRDRLHAELGEILIGRKAGREREDEVILLNPMGMAVEDIACAQAIYERAIEQGAGVRLSLL